MTRAKRTGKVFVDWSQNDRHKTTVSAYSLRLQPAPTVSTPIGWDEVEDATDPDELVFEASDVLARVDDYGDLYEDALIVEQELPEL